MSTSDNNQPPWFQVPWDPDYRFPTEFGLKGALLEVGRRLVTLIAAIALVVLLPFLIVVGLVVAVLWLLSQASSDRSDQRQPQPASDRPPAIYAADFERSAMISAQPHHRMSESSRAETGKRVLVLTSDLGDEGRAERLVVRIDDRPGRRPL
jgi:hypothetical protein